MRVQLSSLFIVTATLVWTTGCPKPAETTTAEGTVASEDGANHAAEQGHVHEGDDELFWQRKDLEHEGYVISLGHHGLQLYSGHDVEPAVMVTKDGQPSADAKVFVTLLNEAGDEEIVAEQPTIYEPPTDTEPAHYAQAKVAVPKDAKQVTLRYRIELPGASEFEQDVAVEASAH